MAVPEYGNLEARREAREAVSGPGKFEGETPMTAILYSLSLSGFADDSESDDGGFWADRIGRYVIEGDPQGFVTSVRFASESEAIDRFERAYRPDDDTDDTDDTDDDDGSYVSVTGAHLDRSQCDQCAASFINGTFCHESGCPNRTRSH